jgi:hypothetical protein
MHQWIYLGINIFFIYVAYNSLAGKIEGLQDEIKWLKDEINYLSYITRKKDQENHIN